MSAISNDPSKQKSGKLNTTINPEVLNAFRQKCKKTGVQMNTLIEAFMRQYVQGGFYLKFGRETDTIDVVLDEKEYSQPMKAPDSINTDETIKENFGEYSD